MTTRVTWNSQLIVVALCALALKFHYSTASPDQLRWILAPTTVLVELLSGVSFKFESYAGYMSGDHTFVIAAACAGVNFLITSFLMLSLRTLWTNRGQIISWRIIPVSVLYAYLTTLVANTVRICLALRLRELPREIGWLDANQLHRLEGIVIYFGFLLLLFAFTEKTRAKNFSALFRLYLFPLLIYYGTTLGIPLANGAFWKGTEFWEYSLFVLLIPLILIIPFTVWNASSLGSDALARHRKIKKVREGDDRITELERTV
jgi:exosortase K